MNNIHLTYRHLSSTDPVSGKELSGDFADPATSLTRTEKRILDAGFAGFIIGAAAAALIFVFL